MQGAQAEDAALRHLQQAGLRLVARNARFRGGELDLVMRDAATLVFVEVRSRRSFGFASAAESVDARKRAKLLIAAQLFVAQHPEFSDCAQRFDVFTFDDGRPQWIVNAFDGA